LFEKLDSLCNPETILATNTSTIIVTQLAKITKRPEKVIGTHFLAPRPIGKLLELVKTELCSEDTLNSVIAFSKKIDREFIISPDIPGFIVNRIYMSYVAECLRLLEAGYVTKESLEKVTLIGIGMPISPLRYLDVNGIDIAFHAAQSMYEQTLDPRWKPSEILKKMVADEQLGLKTKKGFYDY
jgi:3-hydroxybutyryl-CoA dehydrogenase